MSRNGTGTYSVPNTFVAGGTITASDHNENWSDVASEVTNSVAADGQTSMTGPLRASSGTLGSPSITFAADSDTGRYRKSSNTMADVVGGAEVVEISSSGINVTGKVSENGASLLPAGVILPYGGSSAPTGFLLCYGQSVSRTTYATLFAAIGTTFGSDDASTFKLPDGRGRTFAGADNMGGSAAGRLTSASSGVDGATLGATGGAQTVTLDSTQIPSHTHTASVTDNGHTHTQQYLQNFGGGSFTATVRFDGSGSLAASTNTTASATTGITVSNSSTGGGLAHNNVQPTIITNYIIKY